MFLATDVQTHLLWKNSAYDTAVAVQQWTSSPSEFYHRYRPLIKRVFKRNLNMLWCIENTWQKQRVVRKRPFWFKRWSSWFRSDCLHQDFTMCLTTHLGVQVCTRSGISLSFPFTREKYFHSIFPFCPFTPGHAQTHHPAPVPYASSFLSWTERQLCKADTPFSFMCVNKYRMAFVKENEQAESFYFQHWSQVSFVCPKTLISAR